MTILFQLGVPWLSGVLCGSMWVLGFFSSSMRNIVRILIHSTLNIFIAFCRNVIFMVLILPVMTMEFFLFSSVFSISSEIYSFNSRGLSPCLGLFLCYFFEVIMSGSLYMTFLSVNLLLVYRKAIAFYKLILHPVTLLKFFCVLNCLLVSSLNSLKFDDICDCSFKFCVSGSLPNSHWKNSYRIGEVCCHDLSYCLYFCNEIWEH